MRLRAEGVVFLSYKTLYFELLEAVGASRHTDKLIKTFPEVVSVYGKAGRADTATDPAPLDMIESVVRLQTDEAKWRKRRVANFFDHWPQALKWPFQHTFWPAERRITMEELVYGWTDADGTNHLGRHLIRQLLILGKTAADLLIRYGEWM